MPSRSPTAGRHSEILNYCIDLEGCRSWTDEARLSFERFSKSPDFYPRNRPLRGQMSVSHVMLMGPAHEAGMDELSIQLKVNGKVAFSLPPSILRVYSMQHTDPGRVQQLINAMQGAKMDPDLMVSLSTIVQRALEVPMVGYRFHIPIQLTEPDDVTVHNLAFDNRLFLLGLRMQELGT